MKEHDVFRHSDGRIETVKRGWSWLASLFCWFWALAKRMWLLALAVMAANGFVAGFISLLDQLGYPVGVLDSLWMAGILLLQVVFGLYGNAWRAVHLLRRGYVLESPQAPSAWPVAPR